MTTPHGGQPSPPHDSLPAHEAPPLDDDLRAWRDAAVSGGLPTPSRSDRWQPLRAGVVGLWEFEVAEYWFARGWAQLTGRNETGKSSLMALTTLIPWLGSTATGNIDTLGEHGKQFRYYVEPTTNDGDRRDADSAVNRGWLWVEYGRVVNGAHEYVTTAMFAEARRAASQITPRWCTARGARVRDGLELVTDGFVASAKELEGVPGFEPHRTAGDYRRWCADILLGTDTDRLDAVGKLLRVTRTPKLGERLNIGFVSAKMREALPELERAEIDALATGWDQLDAVRADADAAREAASAVGVFLRRGWRPWAHARLRSSADKAASARSAFDAVTRTERAAKETLAQVESVAADNARELSAALAGHDAESTALEELQASARYTDAAGRLYRLEAARRDASQAHEAVGTAHERLAGEARLALADADAARAAEAEVEPTRHRRDEAESAVLAHLESAGLSGHADAAKRHDLDRLDQAVRQRRAALDEADSRLAAFAKADQIAELRESEATEAEKRSRGAREQAEAALAEAERAHEHLGRTVAAWASGIDPAPENSVVDAWIAGLPGTTPGVQAALDAAIRRDWYEPVSRQIAARVAASTHRRDLAADAVRGIESEIEALETAPDLDYPAPFGWARRPRPAPGPQGAPLWWLLNPTSDHSGGHPNNGHSGDHPNNGHSGESLARIEAALTAMGLLDAWVTPDGVYLPERDGTDVLLDLRATPGHDADADSDPDAEHDSRPRRLSAVLTATDALGPVGERARELLQRVGFVESAAASDPTGGPAPNNTAPNSATPEARSLSQPYLVGADGTWRTPLLAGRAEPLHPEAEWLGDEARRAARARKLAEARERLAAAQAELAQALEAVEQAEADRARAEAAYASRPDEAPLLRALVEAGLRREEAERAAAEASSAVAAARAARETADAARARLLEYTAEHRLPGTPDGLRTLRQGLHDVELSLGALRFAIDTLATAERTAASAVARAAASEQQRQLAEKALDEQQQKADAAQAAVAALESLVDADTREVLDEVERRRAEVARLWREQQRLQGEAVTIAATVGKAQQQLGSVEEKREQRTAERDAAFASFRRLIDAGLVTQARLELPDIEATTVEAVRNQVAALREAIRVPNWPDDPEAQQDHIDRAWSTLVNEGEKARAVLETRGRTLRTVTDEELPRVEIVVDSSGVPYGPHEAATRLEQIRDDLGRAYDQRVQHTLSELLGSTFIEHLRAHLVQMRGLVGDINTVLRQHPTGTTRTALRIRLDPREGATADVLAALEQGTALLDESVSGGVREFLRGRVEGAREEAAAHGESEWGDRLAGALDYRQWFDVSLEKRSGDAGRWTPLTPSSYAGLSGGARAVMLMLPLIATLAALYGGMSGAPRPLWLDEAFDGLDSDNRAMVLDLLREFDLDVLVAGPGRLVNVPTVPAAAIYQVVRAPDPFPGADLTLELWASDTLTVVDLPPATSRTPKPPEDDGPDLWSAADQDQAP